MAALLELRGVSAGYGGATVLRGVDPPPVAANVRYKRGLAG